MFSLTYQPVRERLPGELLFGGITTAKIEHRVEGGGRVQYSRGEGGIWMIDYSAKEPSRDCLVAIKAARLLLGARARWGEDCRSRRDGKDGGRDGGQVSRTRE